MAPKYWTPRFPVLMIFFFPIAEGQSQALARGTTKVGTKVRITSDTEARGSSNWVGPMDMTMGLDGEVVQIDGDGDTKVKFASGTSWWYKPSQVLPIVTEVTEVSS